MMAMGTSQEQVEVAVVGVGRMGRHHARVYHQMEGVRLAAVVDQDAERAATVADQYGCAHYNTVERLLEDCPGLGAVTVAVPTADHAAAAAPLLKRGIACLIEKPLAPTVEQAKAMAQLAARHNAILQVGHTERFNPAVRAVAQLGITPRFIEVHRVSPMTFRSLDVGVVMDMMIHDLDIVLMLAGSPLVRVDAVGVKVLGECEDVANARLVFASGCVANLTASRLALKTQRRMRVFNEDTYVSLDYTTHNGLIIRKSDNAKTLDGLRRQLSAGADLANLDYSELLHVEELTMKTPDDDPKQDALSAQLASFISAVRHGHAPAVDAEAGYAAVEAAQRVVEAIRSHQWEGLADARV